MTIHIADRYLKAWKCSFPLWPREMQNESQSRKQYILSLKSADSGEYNPLVDFMKKCGSKDPTLSELLRYDFYKKNIKKTSLTKLIKAYLRQGCNVNETTNDHHPLQLAIKQGSEEISKMLIQSDANILNRDKSGFTPFEIAIANNYLNIAKIIYDHGYPYIPRHPPSPKLLNYYSLLYKFDRKYF